VLFGDFGMAPSGIGELTVTLLFVAAIWLAGAVYIKAADYILQAQRGRARQAKRGSPGV
jgi:hypothetical protein